MLAAIRSFPINGNEECKWQLLMLFVQILKTMHKLDESGQPAPKFQNAMALRAGGGDPPVLCKDGLGREHCRHNEGLR